MERFLGYIFKKKSEVQNSVCSMLFWCKKCVRGNKNTYTNLFLLQKRKTEKTDQKLIKWLPCG